MQSKILHSFVAIIVIVLIAMPACTARGTDTPPPPTQAITPLVPVAGLVATSTPAPPMIVHLVTPAAEAPAGKVVYDVESAGTAPEKRAPYGDSYEWNRLERPFTQDMDYIGDLDVSHFTVAKDNDWWYVSIKLMGPNPNNAMGINYGVEIDLDRDGYGDYLIWAHPPYTNEWDTKSVQIYRDQNHNTGGLSGGKSDAPYLADGYETLIFDGNAEGSDPDMAWMRINAGVDATVQFAFKRSWAGNTFMIGVIADAGWKDPNKLDYVDRITNEEAGSPVKSSQYYPLKGLVLVDNTCRDAVGFEPTHYEPQICPVAPTPTKEKGPPPTGPTSPAPGGCQPDPTCPCGWDVHNCMCAVC